VARVLHAIEFWTWTTHTYALVVFVYAVTTW